MYLFHGHFTPRDSAKDPEDLWNREVSSFLAALRWNGQIVDLKWVPVSTRKHITIPLVAPARNAFSRNHFNKDVAKAHAELRAALASAPRYTYLGRDLDSDPPCSCRRRKEYILITNLLSIASPVRCGTCYRHVPLYDLPTPHSDRDYSRILNWMSEYQACDTLYIHSGFGEHFGHKHMASLTSPLTRSGRSLCEELAARTKARFYYCLDPRHRWKSGCPSCGKPWELDLAYHIFSHKCDPCMLVSRQKT